MESVEQKLKRSKNYFSLCFPLFSLRNKKEKKREKKETREERELKREREQKDPYGLFNYSLALLSFQPVVFRIRVPSYQTEYRDII